MNVIKFEFFKNNADIAATSYDSTEIVRFEFPTKSDGYLSVGPRIVKVENGIADIDLTKLSDGVNGCYLCINGNRFELPSLDKIGRLFRLLPPKESSQMSRVQYLKELEKRLADMEKRLAKAEDKIYGRVVIL